MKKILLFICLFIQSIYLYAQVSEVVILHNEMELLQIGKQIDRLEEPTANLALSDILKPENQQKFKPNEQEVFTAPSSNTVYWFRFTFENQSTATAWLAFETNYLSYIDFYAPDSIGNYKTPILTGGMRDPTSKVFDTFNYWFPLAQKSTKTYYFRVKANGVVEVPLRIGSLNALREARKGTDFIAAFFSGAMVMIFLYNIFLYFSTRERLFLIYLAYLPFATLTGLELNSYSFLEILLQNNYWHRYLLIWHVPLYIFIIWFVTKYLEIQTRLPYFYKILMGILGVILFVCIGSALVPDDYYRFFYDSFMLLVGIISLIGIYIAIYLVFQKVQSALFFLLGWSFLITSTIIYLATINNLLEYTIFTRNILYLGFASEASLFSLALGYRFNALRSANINIERENQALDQINEELMLKSEQLSQANQTKDKLFSIIAHDLRNPVAALRNVIDILDPEILSSDELIFVKAELSKQFSGMDFTLNNLLVWAKDQMQGEAMKQEAINLLDILNSKIDLFTAMFTAKNITLINHIPPHIHVYADVNHLSFIFRNLINNAIKFSENGGSVTISATEKDNFVTISIQDTGIGLSKEKQEILFKSNASTDGTAGEKGTGLGLILCKEFVEKNGGQIWVKSENGKGSTFYFTMPKQVDLN